MRKTPRLLPSDLDPGPRRVYAAAAVFFVAVLAALVWPVYALVADLRPFVLGMPLSLAWVVGWVVASFLGLLAVYLWEARRGTGGPPGTGSRQGPGSPGEGPAPEGREDPGEAG